MRTRNGGWLLMGFLVACEPASDGASVSESPAVTVETGQREALPASGESWRTANTRSESAQWTGGPGWADEPDEEEEFDEEDDFGEFGEEDQFSWEVFGEIQVQEGKALGGEGGFYVLIGPPEGPHETLCSVYFSWEPSEEVAPACAQCEGTLSVSIAAAEEEGFLCEDLELEGANFLGESLFVGLPGDDTEGFYVVDDGLIEQGLDPWRHFTGYGAFEGETFVMDGIAILE